jgi:hypothetical protein
LCGRSLCSPNRSAGIHTGNSEQYVGDLVQAALALLPPREAAFAAAVHLHARFVAECSEDNEHGIHAKQSRSCTDAEVRNTPLIERSNALFVRCVGNNWNGAHRLSFE